MDELVSEMLEVEKCPGWGGHVWNFHLYSWIDDCILEQGKVLSCARTKQRGIVLTLWSS